MKAIHSGAAGSGKKTQMKNSRAPQRKVKAQKALIQKAVRKKTK